MEPDLDGAPRLGTSANQLGVRQGDVALEDGLVLCEVKGKGLSVTGRISRLPRALWPQSIRDFAHLNPIYAGARNEILELYRLDGAPCSDSDLGDDLALCMPNPKHGAITPKQNVPLENFQEAIRRTRSRWSKAEPNGS